MSLLLLFQPTGSIPPPVGPTPAGRHHRYGVRDGWRLLIFDTPEQAEAARQAIRERDRPKDKSRPKKRKVRGIPQAAQTIDLQELRTEATAVELRPLYDQLLSTARFTDVDALVRQIAERKEAKKREEHARALIVQAMQREEEEIAVILLHLH